MKCNICKYEKKWLRQKERIWNQRRQIIRNEDVIEEKLLNKNKVVWSEVKAKVAWSEDKAKGRVTRGQSRKVSDCHDSKTSCWFINCFNFLLKDANFSWEMNVCVELAELRTGEHHEGGGHQIFWAWKSFFLKPWTRPRYNPQKS